MMSQELQKAVKKFFYVGKKLVKLSTAGKCDMWSWWGTLLKQNILVEILKLGLVKSLKFKFSPDAVVWLRFCSWRLVEILRMKFDHDRGRCAFGNVWKQGSHKLQWNFQPDLYLPLYEPVEWKFLWKVTLVYWCSIMSKFLCKVTKKDINHAKVVYYGTEHNVKVMESIVKSNRFMKVCILVQSICCCLMS